MGVAVLGSAACGPDTSSASTSGTTTATESGDETAALSTETETDTGDTPDDQTNTSGGFYAGPDVDFGMVVDCDPFMQDCPEGEKCVPYGSTGGNWDANKCVPVTGSGVVGDACSYAGVVAATDDCGVTTHCWDIQDIDGQVDNGGTINMCKVTCDPLAQDCADPSQACYWNLYSNLFACAPTTSELPPGESCGFVNDCETGNYCTAAANVPGCAGEACCATFCDLEDPNACPDPELACLAFFEQGGPPQSDHLGLCVAP